jgi:hypothetical protein
MGAESESSDSVLPLVLAGAGAFALVVLFRKFSASAEAGPGSGEQEGKNAERLDKTDFMPADQAADLQKNTTRFLDIANAAANAADRFALRAPSTGVFDDATFMALYVAEQIMKQASTYVWKAADYSKVSIIPYGRLGNPVVFEYDLRFGLTDRPESVAISSELVKLLRDATTKTLKPGDGQVLAQTMADLAQSSKFRALTK